MMELVTNLVTITAKVTSNNEAGKGGGDGGEMSEPQSWWQRKKKSLDKFNRRARRKCRTAVKSQVKTILFPQIGKTSRLIRKTLKPMRHPFLFL